MKKNIQIYSNVLYGLSAGLLFILLEHLFRGDHKAIGLWLNPEEYLVVILLFVFVSFLTKRLEKVFLFFIVSMFVIEISHFNYFGYLLFPTEFILLFTKSHEVFETLVTVLDVFIRPVIYIVIFSVFFVVLNKYTVHRHRYKKANYLFLLILVISVLNTGLHYGKRIVGDRPDAGRSIVKTSLYTVQGFLGKTLPIYMLDLSIVPKYRPEYTLVKKEKNEVNNVILIIGESLSLRYMSLYGYTKNTTPELDALVKGEKDVFFAKALSAGVFTDTSIPMILNIAKKPDAIEHILSNDTNLFKMASDNGYQTTWVSAQSKYVFNKLRNLIGLKYIDHYYDSSDFGFDNYTSTRDDVLLGELKKIDFTRKNFIVLNMIGSHSPYEERVSDGYTRFGDKNRLQHYENTVAYTDHILSSIIKYIKNNTDQKVFLAFTSDHGESVTENHGGHGNIKDKIQYQVPLVLFAHNFELDKKLREVVVPNQWLSHFDLSLMIAHYLGYASLAYLDESKAYINGGELSGSAGYVEYDIKADRAILK